MKHARALVSALGLILAPAVASAIAPDSTDVAAIIKAVDEQPRGDKSNGRIHMTIRDDDGRTIERTIQTWSLSFDGGQKTLFVIESPEDVRDTGLLSIDYSGPQSDDQWLYLPSLHKVTRIASSGRSGAFLGSDLTYADLTGADIEKFNFTLVEPDVTVDGERCWLVEAVPKTPETGLETGYMKTQYWISKSKLLPVQAKNWVAEGRKLKYLKFSQLEQIDGIWVAKQVSVRVVRSGVVESETVLNTDWIHFADAQVDPADFTERRLERGL